MSNVYTTTVIIAIAIAAIAYYCFQLNTRISIMENKSNDEPEPVMTERVSRVATQPSTNIKMNLGSGSMTASDLTATNTLQANGNVGIGVAPASSHKLKVNGFIQGTKLCVGSTCIDEDHLKILTGGKFVKIITPDLDNGVIRSMRVDGTYTTDHKIELGPENTDRNRWRFRIV